MEITPHLTENITIPEGVYDCLNAIESPHGDLMIFLIEKNYNQIIAYVKARGKDEWEALEKDSKKDMQSLIRASKFVLFFDNKGSMILIFIPVENKMRIRIMESISYGKSWNENQIIDSEDQELIPIGKPIIILNGISAGRILIPINNSTVLRAYTLISQDNLHTIHPSIFIEPGEETGNFEENSNMTNPGTADPIILERLDGSLSALCRVTQWPGIYQAISYDLGETWSETEVIPLIELDTTLPFRAVNIVRKRQLIDQVLLIGWRKQSLINTNSFQMHLIYYYSYGSSLSFTEGGVLYRCDPSQMYLIDAIQNDKNQLHVFIATNTKSITHLIFELNCLIPVKN